MQGNRHRRDGERGYMLLVVVFLATAIAGLAAISSGRVVSEARQQTVLENEARAFNSAYAQIHLALNVVNTSQYTDANNNVALHDAMDGKFGGTVVNAIITGTTTTTTATKGAGKGTQGTVTQPGATQGATSTTALNADIESGFNADTTKHSINIEWLDDPSDPTYGFVEGTSVRVYNGRDYIKRLQRLKGQTVTDVDPWAYSSRYYVIEAAGRSGDTIRLVSALVRETQPFSSFVFFQNRATLGVSGAPRGLIHTNEALEFYFPNGNYQDAVSAVDGFSYIAGATPGNTNIKDGNPAATPIVLEAVDFADLRSKADLYVGAAGLDAEIKFFRNGKIRIRPHTPPRYETVQKTRTFQRYLGKKKVTVTEPRQVKIGKQQVPYNAQVVDYYKAETYTVTQKVKVGETTQTLYKDVQVRTGTKTVTKTKEEPVYEQQTVTKTRRVKVWVPFSSDAGGGTTVGGGATGELGEWVWVNEPYQTQEMVQVGTKTVTYTVQEPVYKTVQEPYTKVKSIYQKQKVTKTRQVPVYKTVTKYRTEPIYETQQVQVTKKIKVYETVTKTYTVEEFFRPTYQRRKWVKPGETGGTIYVDGRITKLYGDLNGRVSIVGNEKVRISGNIRYVDKNAKPAMKNGGTYIQPYTRNPDYRGNSVLGVIARDDIVFARTMPSSAEINGTMLSAFGRVGVDGFWADPTGELHLDSRRNRKKYLTPEQYQRERAYDRTGRYKTRKYVKKSLRRIGGIISNNRIMETYVTAGRDGMARVSAGYKRGNSKFDINMLYNPPPNFVDVPRPVVTAMVPVFLVRDNEQ